MKIFFNFVNFFWLILPFNKFDWGLVGRWGGLGPGYARVTRGEPQRGFPYKGGGVWARVTQLKGYGGGWGGLRSRNKGLRNL